MGSDLINIKDKYGEKMMHLCRKLFSTLLEEEGKLFELMSKHFPYSRYLYDDIVGNSLENNFKNYIYSLVTKNKDNLLVDTNMSPFQLLDEAGYQLYECKCEDDIQSFKKYYAGEEALCSFRGGRLDTCYVFFAVKKNVDEIVRDDFINPMRQDLYGTSVISIQFTRGDVNALSIKNRYNHTVNNPDATFSNNLENIIPGLTRSFEKYYNLVINQNDRSSFEIPGYVRIKNGKYYKYNHEVNNVYYCCDNIIIKDFEIVDKYLEKEKYIVMDYFIIDLVNKRIFLYDNMISDSFVSNFRDIKKIYIRKNKDSKNRVIEITLGNDNIIYIEIDKYNRIVSYKDDNIKNIGNNFLYRNKSLEKIDLPSVCKIGHGFLASNSSLKELEMNKLLEVGDGFLYQNQVIIDLKLDGILKIGRSFLSNNNSLTNISMPSLEYVGDDFLKKNKVLSDISMPYLSSVGDNFLKYNQSLYEISFPNLGYVGDNFIEGNKIINKVYLPYLTQIKNNFLYLNRGLEKIDLKYVRYVGDNFMHYNRNLTDISMPLLQCVGDKFLYKNNSIINLCLPELFDVGKCFMFNNNSVRELSLLNLSYIGIGFFENNSVLEKIDVSLDMLGEYSKYFDKFNGECKKRILK